MDTEFANLRSGFEWAAEHGHLEIAADIAAHSAILAFPLQQFEPTRWAESLLPRAIEADLSQLPRLYGAAVLCTYSGRKDEAEQYGRAALALKNGESFHDGWNEFWAAVVKVVAGGDPNGFVATCEVLANRSGPAKTLGLFGMFYLLPACGRADEAMAIADEVLREARANGNPFWIGWLHAGFRTFTETDPERARHGLRDGLVYARKQRLPFVENRILQELAWLEVLHGTRDRALELFDRVLDAFHRAGNQTDLPATLCYVAMFFERIEQTEAAATLFGSSRMSSESWVVGMPAVLDRLVEVLGKQQYDSCVAIGREMESSNAVYYAREQIRLLRETPATGTKATGVQRAPEQHSC